MGFYDDAMAVLERIFALAIKHRSGCHQFTLTFAACMK